MIGDLSMRYIEAERLTRQENVLVSLGFTADEAETLRRASMTLHRWFEHECNGAIQRDDETNVPYWYNTNTGNRLGRAQDRETGALRRIETTIRERNARSADALAHWIQGDPRGASLYILRPGDVPEGEDPGAYYSRGICVY